MATSFQRPTAKIYEFPVGSRLMAARLQRDVAMAAAVNPDVMYGSWYHDEAIATASSKAIDKPHA